MDDAIDIELDTLKIKGDPTKLYEELAKAQAKFDPVPKGSEGQIGQQKFRYASYATLIRCVRPALSAHGITILQPLHWRDEMAITTTILAGHGCSIQASFAFKAEFTRKTKDGTVIDDPQEFGRHHTYYRRYQLQAMLGIEGDKDADELPDVNEERAQFREPARDATTGEAVPSKPVSSPKAQASVETKSVSAEPTPTPSVTPSVSSTNGKANGKSKPKAEAKPETPKAEAKVEPPTATKTINEMILSGMRELSWELGEVKEFYKEHVDPAGFDKTGNMTIEQKRELFKKMVELKNVTPF